MGINRQTHQELLKTQLRVLHTVVNTYYWLDTQTTFRIVRYQAHHTSNNKTCPYNSLLHLCNTTYI